MLELMGATVMEEEEEEEEAGVVDLRGVPGVPL